MACIFFYYSHQFLMFLSANGKSFQSIICKVCILFCFVFWPFGGVGDGGIDDGVCVSKMISIKST